VPQTFGPDGGHVAAASGVEAHGQLRDSFGMFALELVAGLLLGGTRRAGDEKPEMEQLDAVEIGKRDVLPFTRL